MSTPVRAGLVSSVEARSIFSSAMMLELSRSTPGPGEGEPSSASGDILKLRYGGVAERAARSTRMKCNTADSVEGGTQAGRLQFPRADVSIWQTRWSGIEPVNQAAGAIEGCAIAHCPVLGTKSRAQLRSSRRQCDLGHAFSWRGQSQVGTCCASSYSGLCSARVGRSGKLLSAQAAGSARVETQRYDSASTNGRREADGGGGGSAGLEEEGVAWCGTAWSRRGRMRLAHRQAQQRERC